MRQNRLFDVKVSWADFKHSEFIYPPCPICGIYQYSSLATVVINFTEFHIVKCPICSLMWRTPLPDSDFLTDLYSEKYYNVRTHSPDLLYQVGIEDFTEKDQKNRREKTQIEVQNWIDMGIKSKNDIGETKKMLEIGGGRGYLQLAAKEKGWSTIGLEISPYGIKSSINKEFTVLPITLEELCAKYIPHSNYFDLVVFFDFIEHVTDPVRILRMIHYLLKNDGIIALRIPNTLDCPKLHLIDHIWHFSDSSLKILLEREGFSIFKQYDSGIFKSPDGNIIHNISIFAKKS